MTNSIIVSSCDPTIIIDKTFPGKRSKDTRRTFPSKVKYEPTVHTHWCAKKKCEVFYILQRVRNCWQIWRVGQNIKNKKKTSWHFRARQIVWQKARWSCDDTIISSFQSKLLAGSGEKRGSWALNLL